MSKRRIAVWMFGGIGTGHFSQGMPALEQLVNGMTEVFEVVVYSLSKPNRGYHNVNFIVRSPASWLKYSFLRWLSLAGLFLRDHAKERFSLVLAFWGWPSGIIVTLFGKMLGLPTAIYVLGADAASVPEIGYGIFHRPVLRWIAKWAYLRADLLLAISHYQKDQLSRFGIHRKISVIPWGVNPNDYQFERKIPGEVLHFIHVGHLSEVKDQATLIRTFALINQQRPSELKIFGFDTLNGKMQKLCRDLGLERSVVFHEMVPRDEMPHHYKWADIMLHTSLSEGQCMALTEAAACGVLLAGTPVGLLYDLGESSGITAGPADYKSLAEKILMVIDDSPTRERHVEMARAWSERHSFDWTLIELATQLNRQVKRAGR
ncbi:MAG: glycosyltransferase [Bacteroidota bacterium]|nr:glycosyltransferase [Bacteroidota bacterium]